MSRVDLRAVQRAFGLTNTDSASLSAWASVHRAQTPDGQHVVVKRTAGTEQRATAMAGWTTALNQTGVPVVTPVPLEVPNPALIDGEWWVVYPFVNGRSYDSTRPRDVLAAGDLLGRIHAAPVGQDVLAALRPYAWPQTTRAEVDRDLDALAARLPTVMGDDAGRRAGQAVRELGDRWWGQSLPVLREADAAHLLPRAGVSSDYKAANLIYAPPTLVDPDNGGLEPRLFDLAMAVVLFHHESPTAPGRLFTPAEWEQFYSGYAAHITLTERERELWPFALDHMLWEEGTWVLEDNDDDAWADSRQGAYLRQLAVAAPQDFPLPR